MSIHVALNHVTHYRYDRRVRLSPQIVRLRPAPHCRTPILSYSLTIEPAGHFVNWQQDPFANYLARLVFPEPTTEFKVTVDLVAEMAVYNAFDFFLEPQAEMFPFSYDDDLRAELAPYLVADPIDARTPRLAEFVRGIEPRPGATIATMDFLVGLNQRLQQGIRYLIRMEPGVQTPEETLASAAGSCRDSGWLMVQVLRHLGLAARFVSGYLIQLVPDVKALDGPVGAATDFTDLHAWCEVYLPGAGWIGFDPTSGLLAGEGHIPLACTPRPSSAAPVSGAVDACEVEFEHRMAVERVWESPRVTKPYTEAQWSEVLALGERVDAALQASDVRLTMGGEPTFVSIDDRDGAEWNVDALGPTKRVLALDLLDRLRARYGVGGFLHCGQGKWYPGEPLPRWALSICWRADGAACWSDPALLADERTPQQATIADARRFAEALARRLDVSPTHVQSGFETASGREAGCLLPLRRDDTAEPGQGRWIGTDWAFPGGRLHLVPGDSPMGYRLPLDQLPPQDGSPTGWVVRSALCAEPRGGLLHVFLPPFQHLEDCLDLLAAIEATTAALGLKIVLEGYPPPRDVRLRMLQLTPDPGVIEVNIQPAHSWAELVEHTEFLYDAARLSRLSSEKFMLDGRHAGTGGGNHFVLGGATPEDSPFLRRPELLSSLLAYWHNHPSLSYLFSGLFIGPTSQAPRIDEARNDQLYELEIALAEIERNREVHGQAMPPWLVDRCLRNILIDVTGNTHRSEFCIDKLYSPDTATGRLGLLELRAFEMPPHPRMSIVQQLLLRALVARFWDAPYRAPLQRWGTMLHDRCLLPSFVRQDFDDVLAELADASFALDPAWFAPHFEFRFPRIGEFTAQGVQVSLRSALEPWHVMGEEGRPGGTVRYVDSSLERIELHVTGLLGDRHVVTVNGHAVPLQPTGRAGEFVAGVRFRAWAPASALHPTIGVHAPLTFDLVDTWMQRSLGGCQYHVAHPGGRNYETLPVNAYEAESRRLARFFAQGHTPGHVDVAAARRSEEFPFTLDLRRTMRSSAV